VSQLLPTPVSVAVCTRNRPQELRRCLHSLLTSDSQPTEVLVIDQSDDDRTAEILGEFPDTHLRYVRSPGRGLSNARNVAVWEAIGDVLLFTDDDCTVEPGWTERHATILGRHPRAACSFGSLLPTQHDRALGFVPGFAPPRFRVRSGRRMGLWLEGCGGNFAVRTHICREVGGFDEALGAGARFRSYEERDFACRALGKGYQVIEDPSAVVYHAGFRPYGDGSARRYVWDAYYAAAACQARDIKSGTWWPVVAAGERLASQAATLVSSTLKTGKPTGAGRLASYARGLVDGARCPVDRETGLYQSASWAGKAR
jgi:glycosyltransferase involved in cell wall biosynthesis